VLRLPAKTRSLSGFFYACRRRLASRAVRKPWQAVLALADTSSGSTGRRYSMSQTWKESRHAHMPTLARHRQAHWPQGNCPDPHRYTQAWAAPSALCL